MSDTPRTDTVACDTTDLEDQRTLVVPASFARTLEREAARLAEENKKLQKKCDEWQQAHLEACEMIQAGKREHRDRCHALEAECDRLTEQVKRYRGPWLEGARVWLEAEHAELISERSQMREALIQARNDLESIQEWAKPSHVLRFDDGDIPVTEWCQRAIAQVNTVMSNPR